MSASAHARYSRREYVALERMANVRHEFHEGNIYAMAGGTPEHAALAANVTAILLRALEGQPCRVHSADLRVRIEASGLTTYPDVSVVCGELVRDPEDADAVLNPLIVVEVLSPSTERYDREEKRVHYQQVVSLRSIVLVAHDKRRIDVWSRAMDGKWMHDQADAGGCASLNAQGCVLDVDAVYLDRLTGGFLDRAR
ncbi:MAG: Uma2 family endonuclease [Polyangiales bacterium]